MTERATFLLDDLVLEPPPLPGFFEKPADGSYFGGMVTTREGLHVCRQGRTIVANGCFDGQLHPGHLSLLASLDTIAYQMRLRPVIALNSDDSVRQLKGPNRPIFPQKVRSTLLNHLKWPFTVIIFDEPTPQRLMDLLQPAAVLKGSEYPKESVVRWRDSQVITVDMIADWSTSRILGDTR